MQGDALHRGDGRDRAVILRSRRRRGVAAAGILNGKWGRRSQPGPVIERIAEVTRQNRAHPDPAREREIIRLRHQAGVLMCQGGPGSPSHPSPAFDQLPSDGALSAVTPARLNPEVLRAGILTHGCLMVRGLLDPDRALELAEGVSRAFDARLALRTGDPAPAGYYDEFDPDAPYHVGPGERQWVEEGGGVWAVDSPRVMFELLEDFERLRLGQLVSDYLGEPALVSMQKGTLRKAEPSVGGAWHQDGRFMGDVRSLNLWLSLSRCGDQAPGLDIVPRRLDGLVDAGGEGTFLHYQISQATAEEAAGEVGIMRPIFEPGDALLFDDLFLHQTGSDPAMPNPRYAVESWFFGKSGFPSEYAPLVP